MNKETEKRDLRELWNILNTRSEDLNSEISFIEATKELISKRLGKFAERREMTFDERKELSKWKSGFSEKL